MPTTIRNLLIGFLILWAIVFMSPFVVVVCNLTWVKQPQLKEVLSQFGTFGDMFNILNSLFTGCALAGVIYTAILQRHQITMQLDELKIAREHLEMAQAEEAEREVQQTQIDRDRRNARSQAFDQKRMTLFSSILNAKTAILLANAQIMAGGYSGGMKDEWKRKAEKWIDIVEAHMQADEQMLTELSKKTPYELELEADIKKSEGGNSTS